MKNESKLTKSEAPKYTEIIESCNRGDIHKVHDLYKKGIYPKDAILIGLPLEISSNGVQMVFKYFQ